MGERQRERERERERESEKERSDSFTISCGRRDSCATHSIIRGRIMERIARIGEGESERERERS